MPPTSVQSFSVSVPVSSYYPRVFCPRSTGSTVYGEESVREFYQTLWGLECWVDSVTGVRGLV